MSFLGRLFKNSSSDAANGGPLTTFGPPAQGTAGSTASQSSTRRELLRAVLRDTMHRHGIPDEWITGEALAAISRQRVSGVHWRLLIRHWDPRLLMHSVALQRAMTRRIASFDPAASTWLMGISWQFALADESQCPPLPPAGSWAPAPVQRAADIEAGSAPLSCDIFAGPETSGTQSAREDLHKLFAVRDADLRRQAQAGRAAASAAYDATQPAPL